MQTIERGPRSARVAVLLGLVAVAVAQGPPDGFHTGGPPASFQTLPATAGPSATTTTTSDDSDGSSSGSSMDSGYYFVLIAVLVILLVATACTIYGRKRNALPGFLSRRRRDTDFAARRGWGMGRTPRPCQPSGSGEWIYINQQHPAVVEEGLNESGEAPPPYSEGAKPPSIEHVFAPAPQLPTANDHDRDLESGSVGVGNSSQHDGTTDAVAGSELRPPEPAVLPQRDVEE